jgi:hypothetical protein
MQELARSLPRRAATGRICTLAKAITTKKSGQAQDRRRGVSRLFRNWVANAEGHEVEYATAVTIQATGPATESYGP